MRPALLVLAACATARPIGINDPRPATAFYCSVADAQPLENLCMTTEEECVGVVAAAARRGSFMSKCDGRATAWCAVSTMPNGRDLYSCAPTRRDCGYRLEVDGRINRTMDSGECVERRAGE